MILSLPIDTVDSMVIQASYLKSTTKYINKQKKRKKHNLCLDKAYHSKGVEQELSKDDIYHIYRRERRKKIRK
ncbi:MAG TPA: hypothetical protein VJ767_00930 [Nitrososphaeraceae archaeon]|nr:hypothetical protein [Nitrososphaeraceae archaeon]